MPPQNLDKTPEQRAAREFAAREAADRTRAALDAILIQQQASEGNRATRLEEKRADAELREMSDGFSSR